MPHTPPSRPRRKHAAPGWAADRLVSRRVARLLSRGGHGYAARLEHVGRRTGRHNDDLADQVDATTEER